MPAFHEIAAGPGRRARDVVRPGEARHDVPRTDQVRVFEAPGEPVAPRGRIREAIRRLDFAEVAARQLRIAAHRGARPVVAQATARRTAGELVLEAGDEVHRT